MYNQSVDAVWNGHAKAENSFSYIIKDKSKVCMKVLSLLLSSQLLKLACNLWSEGEFVFF